jgi:cell division protease FtsH
MSQDPQNEDPRNRGESFNWRGLLLLLIACLLFGLAFAGPLGQSVGGGVKKSYPEFQELLRQKKIVASEADPLSIIESEGKKETILSGTFIAGTTPEGEPDRQRFRTVINLPIVLQDKLLDELAKYPADGSSNALTPGTRTLRDSIDFRNQSNVLPTLVVSLLPILMLLAVVYFLFRHQMKMAGRGAMSFGKSKAKMMSMDKNKVTFKNVAGVEEAKEEVWEIVEFLKDPKKFQRLGGRIPKGVLMVGPPGTGKTLLARAIAGEADVPFFTISGSDFVEMFVGVGASRVRDMFEQGKKNAPCLIFIDEIDAVGRHRGHGLGGGHDEREQTLNALLVEMDGFDTTEGVIIIAATNRPDVLDPALLRPGRFDRQITVNLPDVKGREEILRVHARKVKLGANVDLALIARGTPGYSGAELANVINEGALLAARKNQKAITQGDLEEARDKVRWGRERRSLVMSEKEKENTAYHEAGHAILNELLEHTDPLHKVTIIPRGPALGVTMFLPEEDKFTHRKHELLDNLVVAMGGRVAEEIVFGDVTNGARGDIKMATNIARKMVCEWGMSDELGMVEYGENHEHLFLGRDMGSGRNYSDETARKIDTEVKLLIDTAYNKAKTLLVTNRTTLDRIAKALLEYETLDGDHIRDIMHYGEMRTPPSSPKPPPLSTGSAESGSTDLTEGELPGGLAPVGA